MKRQRSPSSSSSSSDSCVIKQNVGGDHHQKQPPSATAVSVHQSRAKRVRKKQQKPENSTKGNNGNKRSSIYRGVTRHRWTGRYEAHLWDKGTWNNIQNKKGKQIYLGAYDNEEAAARTYDLAALKYWGPDTTLNFPAEKYSNEIEEMQKLSKEEYLASLRRLSSGFSRGVSKYRGVARHHHNGRWEARIGRVSGNKYLYLGTYNTQEEAAIAYDKAAITYRGANAVTNFHISNYLNNDEDENEKLKKQKIIDEERAESSIGEHQEVIKLEEVASSKEEGSSTEEKVEEDEAAMNPKAEGEECDDVDPNILIKEEVPAEFTDEILQIQEETAISQSLSLKYETGEIMMAMEDSPRDDEFEHPWDLCLDLALHSLPDSDIIPMDDKERSLSDLFGDIEIPDSIDFMFDNAAYGYEFDLNKDAMLGTMFASEKVDEAKEDSTSPSSTTTSV